MFWNVPYTSTQGYFILFSDPSLVITVILKANEKNYLASLWCDLNNTLVLIPCPSLLRCVSYTSWHVRQSLKERNSSQNQRWLTQCPGFTAIAWLLSLKLAIAPEPFPPLRPPRCAVKGSGEGLVWREVASTCCPPSVIAGDAAGKTAGCPITYIFFIDLTFEDMDPKFEDTNSTYFKLDSNCTNISKTLWNIWSSGLFWAEYHTGPLRGSTSLTWGTSKNIYSCLCPVAKNSQMISHWAQVWYLLKAPPTSGSNMKPEVRIITETKARLHRDEPLKVSVTLWEPWIVC